jgi:DUF1680 family protein
MNRRKFLATAAALPFAAHTAPLGAQSKSRESGRPDRAASPGAGTPNLDRYHLTRDRVLHGDHPAYSQQFVLEDLRGEPGRRFTNFSGDVSGRWIGALAACSAAFGDTFPELDEFVKTALPLQHPEGYFGKTFNGENPGDDDLALLWGNGRLLVGLMEYHALHRDSASLAAARRLGDFLVAIGPKFNSQKMADDFGAGHFATSYICWTQQTEGLAALYAETKEPKYRDLCADISARMSRRPGDHVHGYLCSVRGTLALYEAARDQALLRRVLSAWDDIANSGDILITGGVPEAWSPKKKRTEGCAECDWLRLNLALHRATGEEKYLSMAEWVLFNEFSMNQFATGDFGHANLYEDFTPETVAVRAWWCCTLHGLRAFADVRNSVFGQDASGLAYLLPIDGHLNQPEAELAATSTLATDSTARLAVKRGSFDLHVRSPHWAKQVIVRKNGKTLDTSTVAGARAGDEIVIRYEMDLRAENADSVQSHPGHKSLHFGPWLLGASSQDQPEYFNELFADNQLSLPGREDPRSLNSVRFGVPVAARTCACIPAEFPGQPMTVNLRAVAEQTGYPSSRWQTAFQVQEKA